MNIKNVIENGKCGYCGMEYYITSKNEIKLESSSSDASKKYHNIKYVIYKLGTWIPKIINKKHSTLMLIKNDILSFQMLNSN